MHAAELAKKPIKALARRTGYEIHSRRYSLATLRQRLLAELEINVVLDVGAYVGAYALALRADGYRGRIESFEPQYDAYSQLMIRTANDPGWSCHGIALGSSAGEARLHISGGAPASSSVLAMSALHQDAAPGSETVRTGRAVMQRIDSLHWLEGERLYLKADVQGLELEVLRGTGSFMASVHAVEVELSLVPLYDQQPLMGEVIAYLEAAGFDLVGLEPGFWHPRTGRLLQMDGIFTRQSS